MKGGRAKAGLIPEVAGYDKLTNVM